MVPPLPEEAGEAPGFARVRLCAERRRIGRLRELIDRLNALVPENASPPREALPPEIVATPLSLDQEEAEQDLEKED